MTRAGKSPGWAPTTAWRARVWADVGHYWPGRIGQAVARRLKASGTGSFITTAKRLPGSD